MVTADKYFSLSVGPPAGKPAKPFFLGPGSDICNADSMGFDGNFPRLSSQAIFSREPSADDTLSVASVAAIRDGAAAVACGCGIASAARHNSRHDIPGGAEERSDSRRFAASHPSSWPATITAAASILSPGCAEALTPAQAIPHLPCKGPKEEKQEMHHRKSNAYIDITCQKMNQSQAPLQSKQKFSSVQNKGIYAGLVMVETKCIEVDNAQNMSNNNKYLKLDDARIQDTELIFTPNTNGTKRPALTALHNTLLHEHHDFFPASQHPAASPALRRLASKYAMPAPMWRHGIHSFLELLRQSLPESVEHMLAFINAAYDMMALLYETVPAFEDTWIECLGDLGRYRMAIEDDDIRDREVWTGVSRRWYHKAPHIFHTAGRLYHHLAILARPNAVQQLFYYNLASDHPNQVNQLGNYIHTDDYGYYQ
ncbi:hypothetical protein V8C42DRAFT_135170 [Trichoderma barbatum]